MRSPVLASRSSVASTQISTPLQRSSCVSTPRVTASTQLHRRIPRRRLVEGSVFFSLVPFLQLTKPALAEESVVSYEDSVSGFSLSYPNSWTSSELQTTGKEFIAERSLVWYPKDVPPREVNVTLQINNAGADYTGLGSFGTPDDFGQNLVNSMDRRYLLRGSLSRKQNMEDVQTAELVSAKSQRGMYSIEYLLKRPREDQKRLLSLVALRFDGTYNRLYTLTAQCAEVDYSKYQTEIQTVLNSFKPPGSDK